MILVAFIIINKSDIFSKKIGKLKFDVYKEGYNLNFKYKVRIPKTNLRSEPTRELNLPSTVSGADPLTIMLNGDSFQ